MKWLLVFIVWLIAFTFIWALCRAAGKADRKAEQFINRRGGW